MTGDSPAQWRNSPFSDRDGGDARMIDLARCRKILRYGEEYSDEEIIQIRSDLMALGNLAISTYLDCPELVAQYRRPAPARLSPTSSTD